MKSKKTKLLFAFLIIIIIILFIVIFLNSSAKNESESILESYDSDEIPIYLLSPVTGDLSYVGEPAEWAAEYVTELINEAGGINGYQIKLVVLDTEFDTSLAQDYMNQLVDSQLFVLGPIDSPGTTAVSDIISEAGILNIAAYSYEEIREEYAPYALSYMTDSEDGDWQAIQYWKEENPDIESVVIFTCPSDESQMATAEMLEENLESIGIEVEDVIEVETSSDECTEKAIQALNDNVDGYISLLRAEEYAKIVTELRQRGVDEGRRITGSFASYDETAAEIAGKYLIDTYIWTKFDPHYEGDDWQTLVEAYEDDHDGQEPSSHVVVDIYNTFIALKLCMEDLDITNDTDDLTEEREEIANWFYDSPLIEGIQGDFQWIDGKKYSDVNYFQYTLDDINDLLEN